VFYLICIKIVRTLKAQGFANRFIRRRYAKAACVGSFRYEGGGYSLGDGAQINFEWAGWAPIREH
jgi:hypothetical protein